MKLTLTGKSISGGLKISKAQKATITIVGATSVVLGAGIVLIISISKFIDFNYRVIDKQDVAIVGYSEAIRNSGACPAPKSKDGIYTEDELKACIPDSVEPEQVVGSLRYNILNDVSSNINLESVERIGMKVCIDNDSKRPFSSAGISERLTAIQEIEELLEDKTNIKSLNDLRKRVYEGTEEKATTEDGKRIIGKEDPVIVKIYEEIRDEDPEMNDLDEFSNELLDVKQRYVSAVDICAALRVIPDALPSKENKYALLSSLNNIYLLSDSEFEGLTPGGSVASTSIPGLIGVPITLSVKDNDNDLKKINSFLHNVSESIRYFRINTLTISKKTEEKGGTTINAMAEAYFTNETTFSETSNTINAKDKK